MTQPRQRCVGENVEAAPASEAAVALQAVGAAVAVQALTTAARAGAGLGSISPT